MSCNSSNKFMYNEIFEFSILEFFLSILDLEKSPKLKLTQILWSFPLVSWTKINLLALLFVRGCSSFLGIQFLFAKFMGAIMLPSSTLLFLKASHSISIIDRINIYFFIKISSLEFIIIFR